MRLHVTTIAIDGKAVCLGGPSGSGKSDLALRLMDAGAALVSDDYTDFAVETGRLIARAPTTIAGKIELRGVGILTVPHLDQAPVTLFVELVADRAQIPRMPETRTVTLEGVEIQSLQLYPFDCSAPAKIRALVHAPSIES